MAPRPVEKSCKQCGSRLKLSRLQFCSKACSNRARAIPERERFWVFVDKSSDCWLWTGAKDRNGYGAFARSSRVQVGAHRAVWELTYGKIPDGVQVLHRCDVPACVKPAHLWLGTHRDNHEDKRIKGRAPQGQRHGLHRVTAVQVQDIRSRYATGEISQQKLADLYGLSQPSVSAILRRATWARVP